MKKNLFAIITASIIIVYLLTSCGSDTHMHSYIVKYNETAHWKECSCGEKSVEESHTLGRWTIGIDSYNILENQCIACDYKDIVDMNTLKEISWNDGVYLGNGENQYLCFFRPNSTEITEYEIHSSTKIICECAFRECSSLTSITIPNSVTCFGYGVFLYNDSLTNVYYEGSIEDWCNISFNNTSNPMEYASHFYLRNNDNNWEEVTSIEIPNTITEIKDMQFCMFENIKSITIPNSVTSIGKSAFLGCSSLTNIEIPNSVKNIGDNAFARCSSLTSIQIPNSVTSIGEYAFSGCSILTSIEIPNSVTSIRHCAFWNCSSLTSIKIPNSVTSIGEYAFSGCSILTSIEIPNSVTSIRHCAFWNCSSLTSIKIPNSVTTIEKETFARCSSLTSIVIPNSVTIIAKDAFLKCSLKDVYYEGSSQDWSNISNGNSAISSNAVNVYFYLENKPTTSGNYWHYVGDKPTKW